MHPGAAHKSKGWIAQDDIALPSPEPRNRADSASLKPLRQMSIITLSFITRNYRLVTTPECMTLKHQFI
jgi:hypothetical protein